MAYSRNSIRWCLDIFSKEHCSGAGDGNLVYLKWFDCYKNKSHGGFVHVLRILFESSENQANIKVGNYDS